MPNERRLAVACLALATLLGVPATGWAQSPSPGRAITGGTTGFERVQKGVWELGHEQMLLVRSFTGAQAGAPDTTVTQLGANFVGGLTPRYFVRQNLALGLNLNAFLGLSRQSTEAGGQSVSAEHRDLGLLAFALVSYYVRMGFGMFFTPGLGLGAFYGKRFAPDPLDANRSLETTLVGGAARLDLGFVFFASRHINLKAGLDILVRFGSEQPAVGEARSFSSVDAGFHVGMGYTF